MANWIADETGGDLIRVSAKDAYPEDYDDTVDRAKKEQDENSRPEIDVDLTKEQLAGYDTVFFGSRYGGMTYLCRCIPFSIPTTLPVKLSYRFFPMKAALTGEVRSRL
jgi:hypothetical protein